jgi:hypothetical protein
MLLAAHLGQKRPDHIHPEGGRGPQNDQQQILQQKE